MNRSGSKQGLTELVAAEIKKSGLPVETQPVAAAVSGGVDSMVLLWLLAGALKLRTIAIHINYGKRGEESDADEELVRDFCRELQTACVVHRAPAGGAWIETEARHLARKKGGEMAGKQSGNFQEQARDLRRSLLLAAMEEHGACAIFLAHHRDDQTETVIQKILRGAAPEKWTGMRKSDPPWHRPLLDVSKLELLDFAGKHAIPFRTDASNLESGYTRNILRNDVFPILDTAFPEWRRNIERASQAGQRHQELLDYLTGQLLARHPASGPEPGPGPGPASGTKPGPEPESNPLSVTKQPAALDRMAWIALPSGLRPTIARNWIAGQTGYSGWSEGEVQRLAELEQLPTGRQITLAPGLSVMRDRNRFVINTDEDEDVRQLLDITDLGHRDISVADITISLDRYRPERQGHALQLRLEALPEKLMLRSWHAGDRIRPMGMEGSQLISDLLTNKKVSAAQKKSALVLVSFDGNVHAVIFPHRLDIGEIGTIAEHTRCQTDGQPVLLIKKPDHHS